MRQLRRPGGGKTYAQLSAEAIAQPKNAALAGQAATVFKGETLCGLLLNAYAFGTMGMIAGDEPGAVAGDQGRIAGVPDPAIRPAPAVTRGRAGVTGPLSAGLKGYPG